jgi:hypothetical protein
VKRLGVISTMVWDTIHGRDPKEKPVEEWGGIAYGLAALEAALPPDWELVPLIKVGQDLAPKANEFLRALSRRSAAARFVEVPDPNMRITLHYESLSRRCEDLSGGMPVWTWAELGPMVRDLDAIYVNFISGVEMSLETTTLLRQGFAGPLYADLHSLFLTIEPDSRRLPRPLHDAPHWLRCFDVVQLNEDEMELLGPDPMEVAAMALGQGVRLLVVTLGERGAVYFATEPFHLLAGSDAVARWTTHPTPLAGGPIHTALVAPETVLHEGDTTGCGDVFGAALLAQLLQGMSIEPAIRAANGFAQRNVTGRGATNLQYHLRGEIAST